MTAALSFAQRVMIWKNAAVSTRTPTKSSSSSSPSQVSRLDRFFHITERGSSISREIRGGIVTFFSMSYILVLNPAILSKASPPGTEAQLAAGTAFVAAVMTILMGVVANYPMALAAGLGINAMVAYTLVGTQGMTYADAMRLYGSDKPDLRFDIQIVECTDFFANTSFRVFQNDYVGAVVMDGGASQPRRQLDGWQDWAKQRGAKGLAYILVGEDGELSGPVAKNITEEERAGIAAHVGAKPGDCIFFAAGDAKSSRALLGAARDEIAQRLGLIKEGEWAFTWIVDAPLFEPAADAKASGDVALGNSAWTAVHHAFTSPKPESLDTFDTNPGDALAYAYDIVCNGNEIGGGSIRIHRRDVQERVFSVMGITEEEAQEKFGFLLDAFAFGAPPHGGIAFGWDRIVSLLGGFESIRDVIAFPKSGGGVDPLTDAPAPITAAQRKEAGIDAKPKPKAEKS